MSSKYIKNASAAPDPAGNAYSTPSGPLLYLRIKAAMEGQEEEKGRKGVEGGDKKTRNKFLFTALETNEDVTPIIRKPFDGMCDSCHITFLTKYQLHTAVRLTRSLK